MFRIITRENGRTQIYMKSKGDYVYVGSTDLDKRNISEISSSDGVENSFAPKKQSNGTKRKKSKRLALKSSRWIKPSVLQQKVNGVPTVLQSVCGMSSNTAHTGPAQNVILSSGLRRKRRRSESQSSSPSSVNVILPSGDSSGSSVDAILPSGGSSLSIVNVILPSGGSAPSSVNKILPFRSSSPCSVKEISACRGSSSNSANEISLSGGSTTNSVNKNLHFNGSSPSSVTILPIQGSLSNSANGISSSMGSLSNSENKNLPFRDPSPSSVREIVPSKGSSSKGANKNLPFIGSSSYGTNVILLSSGSSAGSVNEILSSRGLSVSSVKEILPSRNLAASSVNEILPSRDPSPNSVNEILPSRCLSLNSGNRILPSSYSSSSANETSSFNDNSKHENPSVSKENFFARLGLISKDTLDRTLANKLDESTPNTSVVSAVDIRSITCQPSFTEDLGFSCDKVNKECLPRNLMPSKHLLKNEQELTASINKYEIFCKGSAQNGSPKLRFRASPVACTYSQKSEWKNLERTYSFNTSDRTERMETIRTGLTKRTRMYLKKCRPCSVVLTRLAPSKIADWCQRKSQERVTLQAYLHNEPVGEIYTDFLRFHPGLDLIVKNPERYADIKSRVPHPIVQTLFAKSNYRVQCSAPLSMLRSYVKLQDVMHCQMSQCDKACYVRGTKIKVRGLKILPLKLWQQQPTKPLKIRMCFNGKTPSYSSDHAYHKLLPSTAAYQKPSTSTVQCSSEPRKVIPVFDLSSDDDEVSIIDNNKSSSSGSNSCNNGNNILSTNFMFVRYDFECYGCNFSQSFQTQNECNNMAGRHLFHYHSVSQPQSFLDYSILDGKIWLVEAFPGYKPVN